MIQTNVTLLGRVSRPWDMRCLGGWDISSAVRRVSSRLYSKFDRNNNIKIFNYSDDYLGEKLVPDERVVDICPSYSRRDVQSSAATYRENPDNEGPPVWSEGSAWF